MKLKGYLSGFFPFFFPFNKPDFANASLQGRRGKKKCNVKCLWVVKCHWCEVINAPPTGHMVEAFLSILFISILIQAGGNKKQENSRLHSPLKRAGLHQVQHSVRFNESLWNVKVLTCASFCRVTCTSDQRHLPRRSGALLFPSCALCLLSLTSFHQYDIFLSF